MKENAPDIPATGMAVLQQQFLLDTILINDSLYCPKCRQETLIEAKNIHVTVIKEPDTLDADDRVIIGTS